MKILAFGGILYDIFDNDKKIGGAPLNFTAHFKKLGGESYILSAVGNDELGNKAIEITKALGVSTEYINVTDTQTGFCKVSFKDNEPSYDLSAVCAYDKIEISENVLKNIKNEKFDILYFGTLAQRNEISRNTLNRLLAEKCFKKIFFDMNLRQNYYNTEILIDALNVSDIVKINRSEFEKLKELGLCTSESELCKSFNIEKLLLTLDKDGMLLYDAADNKIYRSAKPKNKVVSTVGAGDASSACFLYNYLNNDSLQKCVERANIMGDYIVTFKEAIPEYSKELLEQLSI